MGEWAEITFETEETIRLRKGYSIINEFCPGCRELVDMATPQAIAIWANVSERLIFRLIESGSVHYVEKTGIYICLSSLAAIRNEVKQ